MKRNLTKTAGATVLGLAIMAIAGTTFAANKAPVVSTQNVSVHEEKPEFVVRSMLDFFSAE